MTPRSRRISSCGDRPDGPAGSPDFRDLAVRSRDLEGPNGKYPPDFLNTEKKALGALYNTQGKPKVGPYAPGWVQPSKPT